MPGILEVTAYRLALRAYPYDRIDPTAHMEAMAAQARMPPAPRRFQDITANIGALAIGPAWQCLGPRNLYPFGFQYMGPYRLSGRVSAAAFDPVNTQAIWVCTSRGGVWKSEDLGQTWTSKSVGWATQQTSSIAVCPSNSSIVYVGTGSFEDSAPYPDGIYKTVNGGSTWSRIGTSQMMGLAISAITVDPEDVNVVMAATGRGPNWNGGIWRSADAGNTWTRVLDTPAPWADLKYGASAGVWRYYYAVCLGTNPEIWRSNERGLSWTKVPLPFAPQFEDSLRVAPSPLHPTRVYLLSVRQKRVWRSDDAGNHWNDITFNFGDGCAQAGFNTFLTCTWRPTAGGPRDTLYAGALSVWVSLNAQDGWPTWQDLGKSYAPNSLLHADQHCMAVAPYNPNRLLIGNDGGAYLVHFDPVTNGWTVANDTNAGLVTILANRIAVAQTDPYRLLCGNQDNANSVCLGDLSTWTTRYSGDGTGVAIHPTDADIQYCTSQGIGIIRTGNNWTTYKNISPNTGSDRKGPFTHLTLDPSNPGLLYTGTNYLWRWNDHEGEWDERLGNTELAIATGIITAIAVAPSANSHLYVGASRGELWVSADYGDHWTYIQTGSPRLPDRAITGIAVHPTDPAHVFVTVGGTGPEHVFRCENVFATPRVWSDITGTGNARLPSAHVNCVALDPTFPTDHMYVGTDIGVFSTLDGGAHWSNATEPLGLPNVEVTDLKIAHGHLYAATYGRGLWRVPLLAKGIQVLYPNGAVAVPAASQQTVRWKYAGPETGRVDIDLMKNGQFVQRIAENVYGWYEQFDWTVPEDLPLDGDYAIRAVTLDEAPSSDISDGPFAIVEAERITVTAPDGGETLSLGQATEIRWTHSGALGSAVRIELERDGSLVRTIVAQTPIGPKEGMTYGWTVPTDLSVGGGYKVRLRSVDKPTIEDVSDAPFAVSGADTLTIEVPNGGELWAPGSRQGISWNYTGRPGNYVSLVLVKAGADLLDIATSVPVGSGNEGRYEWTVDPGLAPGVDYAVHIRSVSKPHIQDVSDAQFSIGVEATQMVVTGFSAEYCAQVTLRAALYGTDSDPVADRTVQFRLNGVPVGETQTNASGTARLPVTLPADMTPGDWSVSAFFAGDSSYAPASSTATCTVTRSATSLAVPASSGTVGVHAEVSAILTRQRDAAPIIGARVTFRLDGVGIGFGQTDAAGRATCMFRVREDEQPGDRVVEAAFDGDTLSEPSSGTGAFSVALSPTILEAADAVGPAGAPVTVKAVLRRTSDGLPMSGRVLHFAIEGSSIGEATTGHNGLAELSYEVPGTFEPRDYPLQASFSGDSGHLPSSANAVLIVVGSVQTTLWTVNRSGTITEQAILRQYDLKRTTDDQLLEGKTILFKIDGSDVGTAVTNAGGDSTLIWYITEGPATRTITVEFAGDATYRPCSATATLTCQSWGTKMATFDRTARITDRTELKCRLLRSDNVPLYNKSINFYVDGTFVIARPTNTQGYASHPYYDIPDGAGAGTRTILSEWVGNGGYAPISKTATLTVLKALPYIWVLPKSVPQGAIANLYAYFRRLYDYRKQEGKTVTFRIDGTWIANVVTGAGEAEPGVARYFYNTSGLAKGTHTIRCEFAGDAWVEAGYGEATLTIY